MLCWYLQPMSTRRVQYLLARVVPDPRRRGGWSTHRAPQGNRGEPLSSSRPTFSCSLVPSSSSRGLSLSRRRPNRQPSAPARSSKPSTFSRDDMRESRKTAGGPADRILVVRPTRQRVQRAPSPEPACSRRGIRDKSGHSTPRESIRGTIRPGPPTIAWSGCAGCPASMPGHRRDRWQ